MTDKIELPEELWNAILQCAISADNSTSGSVIEAGQTVYAWLTEETEIQGEATVTISNSRGEETFTVSSGDAEILVSKPESFPKP